MMVNAISINFEFKHVPLNYNRNMCVCKCMRIIKSYVQKLALQKQIQKQWIILSQDLREIHRVQYELNNR